MIKNMSRQQPNIFVSGAENKRPYTNYSRCNKWQYLDYINTQIRTIINTYLIILNDFYFLHIDNNKILSKTFAEKLAGVDVIFSMS